jgi:hypothetical protein
MIVLLGMGLYLYKGIPPFTRFILGWVSGATTAFAKESRRVFTKSHYFGGEYRGQGLIRTFMGIGWPFLLAISLTIYDKTKKKGWLLATLLFLLLSFVFIAGDGTRGPFLFAMFYILVVISMIRRLKMRYLLLVATGLVVVALGMSLASGKIVIGAQDRGITDAVQSLLERIALANGVNSVRVIEFVESGVLDYRHGQVHWQKVLNALPGVQFVELPFSYELGVLMGAKGKTTFASMTYLGMVFVDFGLPGVMGIYMILGCTLGLAQRILFSSGKKTPLQLALIGFTSFYLGQISLSSFVSFISSYVVVLMICFTFIVGASLEPIIVLRRSIPISNKA